MKKRQRREEPEPSAYNPKLGGYQPLPVPGLRWTPPQGGTGKTRLILNGDAGSRRKKPAGNA